VYGQYMLSHNINPESGGNIPQYNQTYKGAGMKSFGKGDRVQHLPRKPAEGARMTENMVKEVKKRNPIMPEDPQKLKTNIVAPNLMKSKYFHSEHGGTPEPTEISDDESEVTVEKQTFSKAKKVEAVKENKPVRASAPSMATRKVQAQSTSKAAPSNSQQESSKARKTKK